MAVNNKSTSQISRRYARALFDLVEDDGDFEKIR